MQQIMREWNSDKLSNKSKAFRDMDGLVADIKNNRIAKYEDVKRIYIKWAVETQGVSSIAAEKMSITPRGLRVMMRRWEKNDG